MPNEPTARISGRENPFTEMADFGGMTFTEGATFAGTTFAQGANFGGTTFTEIAVFHGATFTRRANFAGATFKSSVSFVNSEMRSRTSFDRTAFQDVPPLFYGAKLHEGTTWFGTTWPDARKDTAEAAIGAYERLKLEMDKLKKHEDELHFFALELQTRGVFAGKWTTLHGMAISLYGCLCDYGRSYVRPLWLLGAVVVLGAMPFLFYLGLPGWRGSVALSFANTFGVLGLRREFFLPTVISDLPQMLKLLAIMQTVAGGVLFFLFGLALRNRFRMR